MVSTLREMNYSLKEKVNVGMGFLVSVKIIGFPENRRSITWEGCERCIVKISQVGDNVKCQACNLEGIKPKAFIVLKIDVHDSQAEVKLTVWERVAEEMLDLSADEFVLCRKQDDEAVLHKVDTEVKIAVDTEDYRSHEITSVILGLIQLGGFLYSARVSKM